MNPGGDYGKRELSPALSNRFTQAWVPAVQSTAELLAILESRMAGEPTSGSCLKISAYLDYSCVNQENVQVASVAE